jgi:hypothetical protein
MNRYGGAPMRFLTLWGGWRVLGELFADYGVGDLEIGGAGKSMRWWCSFGDRSGHGKQGSGGVGAGGVPKWECKPWQATDAERRTSGVETPEYRKACGTAKSRALPQL